MSLRPRLWRLIAGVFVFVTAEAAADVELTGSVVDSQGKLVADAEVWLSDKESLTSSVLVAEGRTDAAGRFRLSVADRYGRRENMNACELWCYGAGSRLTYRGLAGARPERPLRARLAPAGEAAFRVFGPENRPLESGKVSVTAIFAGGRVCWLPRELSERFSVEISDGRANLDGVAQQEIRTVLVESEITGKQYVYGQFYDQQLQPVAENLKLLPTGAVRGRVIAPNADLAGGLKMQLTTRPIDPLPDSLEVMGMAEIHTAPDGTFQAPMLAAGKLTLSGEEPVDLAWRLDSPADQVVQAGSTTELEIPLRSAVRVTGIVREQGTKAPLPGVTVRVYARGRNLFVKTADDGRYSFYEQPGRVLLEIVKPAAHVTSGKTLDLVLSPEEAEHEIAAVELQRGVTLRGKAVDRQGNPLAEATIHANWTAWTLGGPGRRPLSTTMSDEEGDFELLGLHPTAELHLFGNRGLEWKAEPLVASADAAEPIRLVFNEVELVHLTGRIVDEQGQGVANATFRIMASKSDGPIIESYGKVDEGKTNADGSFTSVKKLLRHRQYQVQALARSAVVGESQWFTPAEKDSAAMGDVVYYRSRVPQERIQLRSDRALRLVDRQGSSVPDAQVVVWNRGQRIRLASDSQGSIRVPAVPVEGVFLFIDAEGFAFHGQVVQPESEALTVVLHRAGEVPAVEMRTLADPRPSPEALKRAVNWLKAELQEPPQGDDDRERLTLLRRLAAIAPADIVTHLDRHRLKNPSDNNFVLYAAVTSLLASGDIDEALGLVNSMDDPSRRSMGYRDAADTLPAEDRARKLQLLAESLVNARQVPAPDERLINLGAVAKKYLDLGETEQAAQLLREGQTLAQQLRTSGFRSYARGAFAVELAQIDLPAALELARNQSSNSSYDKHHGNIAHELAARQPAQAEQVLGMMEDPISRDHYAIRVCYRMGPVDFERCRRIAAGIEDPLSRAYALGMMARALARRDATAARELLRKASNSLPQLVDSRHRSGILRSPCVVGIGLVPVAEEIDPALVPEFLWRALALRENYATGNTRRVIGYFDGNWLRLSDPVLAALVARYDTALARRLLWPGDGESLNGGDVRFPSYYFAALTILDPDAAINQVDMLPDSTQTLLHHKRRAWDEVLDMLSRFGQQRWNSIHDQQLGLWIPDKEDL